ncbi:TPA: hypothetical protein NI671_002596 [Pseudomonas aeruginosa]|uniref:hypothetical protein n=1 Tax=Pseudomonas aeruginosa TaxID=287 RepID=UPI001D24169B|nr:hypothetical protein [Pseudomonas aeruginosa]MBX6698961.1 hypothetical protein [Pseudomonas aeruginosa]WMX07979.1 hypothetical protein RG643_30055 [Pseudomonas aeruginosa]HCF4366165.1 hypothetical protein [Pseudomonas aeruginosa]HCF4370130.1 hypothetical protein [Pseudomonas aeruginosa]HCF4411221.1 hypothetical protein [Pseudomonas aeruginosa]
MTISMTAPGSESRARWLRIASATWLLLVSAVAIVNSVGLSRLAEQAQGTAQDAQVQALAARMADLERQTAADQRKPAMVSEDRFVTTHQALLERLTMIEQAQAGDAGAGDLQSLRTRVEQLEARLEKLRQAPVAAAASARPQVLPPSKPKGVEPPLTPVGIELRGGERFLSVVPVGTSSLAQVRLLRVGESEAGWQLEAIEPRTAVFRFDGQVQRIALP